MSPVAMCSTLTLTAGALLLALAAPTHVRRRAALTAHLRRHGVLPAALIRAVGIALGPYEALVGAGAIVLWICAPGASPRPGSVTNALLFAVTLAGWAVPATYAVFTVYLVVALRRSPGAPCGCFGDDELLSWASPARSAIFALAPLPAAWAHPALGTAGERATIAAAATLLAALAWAAPIVVGSASASGEGNARSGE